MTYDETHFNIRPSQIIGSFGPGSIYDNQLDSMIIMGLDHWKPDKFKVERDEILLQEIKKDKFSNLDSLYSMSSSKDPEDPGTIPIRSFPTWGFCPKCDKLVSERNYSNGNGMHCDSDECLDRKDKDKTPLPSTYPVRFVTACTNGHLDEFPWYEWVHKTHGLRDKCSKNQAKLYLIYDPKTLSLDSQEVSCKSCEAPNHSMKYALSKDGIRDNLGFKCHGNRPWLDKNGKCGTDDDPMYMQGIFKGASNIYFPIKRSTVTIPPFSDELSEKIIDSKEDISETKNSSYYEDWMIDHFKLRPKFPNSHYTTDDVKQKILQMEKIVEDLKSVTIRELEFQQLNSGENFNDKEFVTEKIEDMTDKFKKYFDKIILVKKTRVLSALIGFTRLDSDSDSTQKFSSISKESPRWLPVLENRGEGIFFSFNNRELNEWQIGTDVKTRFKNIMTVQDESKIDSDDPCHTPKYVFLHTLSHILIKSLATISGYNTASFSERLYCDEKMAGIFIYTASASSDGALGGLVELGRKNENKLWVLIENAKNTSTLCSCDPLCSTQPLEKIQGFNGAACHACTILPETSCEKMNQLLDRDMIDNTFRDKNLGFLKL